MEDMHGSTFLASRADRDRRRTAGPTLTLVRGAADRPRTPTSVASRAHPAFECFTPDGLPGDDARTDVPRSGPESPPVRRPSRGSASPDAGGTAHSGPGPHVPQAELVRRIARYLDELDARSADEAPPARIRRIR